MGASRQHARIASVAFKLTSVAPTWADTPHQGPVLIVMSPTELVGQLAGLGRLDTLNDIVIEYGYEWKGVKLTLTRQIAEEVQVFPVFKASKQQRWLPGGVFG